MLKSSSHNLLSKVSISIAKHWIFFDFFLKEREIVNCVALGGENIKKNVHFMALSQSSFILFNTPMYTNILDIAIPGQYNQINVTDHYYCSKSKTNSL